MAMHRYHGNTSIMPPPINIMITTESVPPLPMDTRNKFLPPIILRSPRRQKKEFDQRSPRTDKKRQYSSDYFSPRSDHSPRYRNLPLPKLNFNSTSFLVAVNARSSSKEITSDRSFGRRKKGGDKSRNRPSSARSRYYRLFRENAKSAEQGGTRKRGYRHRLRTDLDPDSHPPEQISPVDRFRKVARMVQLALLFYSGEGKTRNQENEQEKSPLLDKTEEMRFLPSFDPSLFKAQRIKEAVVGTDIKEILSKKPESRTEEEIQQVLFALRTYETFAEYPLNMQERMCRKAHYLKFGPNRVILRQGDRAEWFYYVLSGTAAVSILEEDHVTKSVNLRIVSYLTRGTAFGELALLHGTRRTATISCKDTVELIAVDKADFVEMNQLGSTTEKEHIKYCRSLKILEGWPVNLLRDVPGVCNFHFFKKGTVMAKSNHKTPFIYIVKSGHVRVLTRVNKVRRSYSTSGQSNPRTRAATTASPRKTTSRYAKLRGRSAPIHSSSRHVKSSLVPLMNRMNICNELYEEVPIQPTFLQVSVLSQGDTFGLSTIAYPDEISCGLVSLGAECIEISKEFFLKHSTENYLRQLKKLVRPYPSEDKLQQDIQDQKSWDNFKQSVVAQILDPSGI